MKTVVLAFEDQYYEELFTLIKRLRRDQGLAGMVLFGTSVRGTGGFINEVPKLLRIPPGQASVLPDLVVCLADADRPGNLLPGAADSPISDDGRALDEWVTQFEGAWREYLLTTARISPQDHVRVRTVCLRWSKESLLVASPDALLEHAAKRERRAEVQTILDQCRPSPIGLADQEYGLRYRSPEDCLNRIFAALEGRSYKKGRHDEDLLRDYISRDPGHRGRLLRRCPDLARLLAVLT